MEKVWQNAASHTNFVKEGPLTDRLRTWTFKGFWLGMLRHMRMLFSSHNPFLLKQTLHGIYISFLL